MRTSFFIALFLCFCNKKQALSHREGRRLHNNKARKNTTIQFKDCSCQTYVFLCIRTQKKAHHHVERYFYFLLLISVHKLTH